MYISPRPYPYLAPGRAIHYVPESDSFMQAARQAGETLSTDRQHPTGSVIVRSGNILARAANQAGFRHPALVRLHEQGFCLRKILCVSSGTRYWLCLGCASPKNHAEALAIMKARQNGVDTMGADLYLFGHWWCCEPCWNAMIAAGIRNVYLVESATERFGG